MSELEKDIKFCAECFGPIESKTVCSECSAPKWGDVRAAVQRGDYAEAIQLAVSMSSVEDRVNAVDYVHAYSRMELPTHMHNVMCFGDTHGRVYDEAGFHPAEIKSHNNNGHLVSLGEHVTHTVILKYLTMKK